ncbi:hypothetical protein E2L92_21975 [Salmonella enterica subsp. enterica serovar Ibadan]|nr:hypothetical protein [Salmonella enterica subsp. enterica serovar Ibadan]ECF3282121.1 hypothetical protein [Salmonella enterica subsp. enterica serovar Ibadan]
MASNNPFHMDNLKPGHGRPPGRVNKTTQERTDYFREQCDTKNVLFLTLNLYIERLINEPEKVKTADLLKAIETFGKYLIQTTAMDQIAEEVANISSREDAERVAESLKSQLRLVR